MANPNLGDIGTPPIEDTEDFEKHGNSDEDETLKNFSSLDDYYNIEDEDEDNE